MTGALLTLLTAAVPVRAAFVTAAPALPAPGFAPSAVSAADRAAPSGLASAALAPLTVNAAPLSAPALTAAPSAAALLPAAAPAALAARLPAPLAVPASPAALATARLAGPAPQDGPSRAAGEKAALEAARMFDGFGTPRGADFVPEAVLPAADAAPALAEGWSAGSFLSADGGVTVAYKRRAAPSGPAPRVYSGGLALNESFDPLFARPGAPARPEYFLWTRGHPPTGWAPTRAPIDADARDLARMIVLAARETGSAKVELALHSFGTLVFQRMVQLREEPEVREALHLLAGSRVVMLNATTHYPGSERRAGQAFEQMGNATKSFVTWLNTADGIAENVDALARLNPYTAAPFNAWLDLWRLQRAQVLSMASKGAADMMKADLSKPWPAAFDRIRQSFLAALARDSQDPAWQESLLRRSSDMFTLDFTKKDVEVLRRLQIRLDLIHSSNDQLLNWQSALALFELLGIEAPAQAPAPGTELRDRTGRFHASIVDSDHYYPQTSRDDLARRLDP